MGVNELTLGKELSSLVSTVPSIKDNLFEMFSIAAVASVVDWNSFIQDISTEQQVKSQKLITNYHTNESYHDNHNNHSDHDNHYNRSTHNDVATGGHAQHTEHNNFVGDPYHDKVYAHTQGGVESGHYDRMVSGGHKDGNWHNNKYAQDHTNRANHSDTGGHSNGVPHDNYYPHSNYGFDHQNYVPSKPALFNVNDGKQLFGTLTIGLFSYDKNKDGFGSQGAISKNVYYDLQIRQVRDINGNSKTSAWRNLANNVLENMNGGIQVNLNTIDPLGTGNSNAKATEGFYEIRAVARNSPQHGVTYVSPTELITVKIQQNQEPVISVTNGNEFINFAFSFEGASVLPSTMFSPYGDFYANAPSSRQEGLLVRINMRDPDTSVLSRKNWQKGKLEVRNASNALIATTDVIWDATGNTVVSSENTNQSGWAFIPISALASLGSVNDAKVRVVVTDYLDSACTTPAGNAKIQTTISDSDSTVLQVDIDVTDPTVTASDTNYNWRNTNISVPLTFNDNIAGIQDRQYYVSTSLTPPSSGWKNYTGAIPITTDGTFYVHYRAMDKAGNERIGRFGPYKLDKTKPIVSHVIRPVIDIPVGQKPVGISNDLAEIAITSSDATSGVRRIQLHDGSWVNGNIAKVYIPSGTYTFRVEDNAGNVTVHTVTVDLSPIATGVVLKNIKNPPSGVLETDRFTLMEEGAPGTYLINDSSLIRTKVGYKMTFEIQTEFTDEIRVEVLSGGTVIRVFDESNTKNTVAYSSRFTGTRMPTTTDITLWLPDTTPMGNISLRVTTIANYAPLQTGVVNISNFSKIVGSSREDSNTNRIK